MKHLNFNPNIDNIEISLKKELRMERLELSQQKLLGPKSSASTNSATPVTDSR